MNSLKKKYFIITVDTEGDDLWSYKPNKKALILPKTENARYIERFQVLCEKYDFFPTYLVDYEMAKSEIFVEIGRNILKNHTGEVGMHMHAFSTPPFYELENIRGKNLAYAGEYGQKELYNKMEYMTKLLQDTFQTSIKSHRGGRWYLDNRILRILNRLGYLVDCTVTPGINWKLEKGQTDLSSGSDYSKYKNKIYKIKNSQMWELPVTIQSRTIVNFDISKKQLLQNKKVWLRPDGSNLESMKWIARNRTNLSVDYIEFMIHSSELMPNGNPNFRTSKDIENLYSHMEELFNYIKEKGYCGITCSEYVKKLY